MISRLAPQRISIPNTHNIPSMAKYMVNPLADPAESATLVRELVKFASNSLGWTQPPSSALNLASLFRVMVIFSFPERTVAKSIVRSKVFLFEYEAE